MQWIGLIRIVGAALAAAVFAVVVHASGGQSAARGGAIEPEGAAGYTIGAGDLLSIWVRDAEEINNNAYTVEESGEVRVPLAGRIAAAGLTVKELEQALSKKLTGQLLEPQVHIRVTEYRSQAVSVLGAVASPGLQQLRGPTPVAELLSRAGGLRPDASETLRISRRISPGAPPLPNSVRDPAGEYVNAELNIAKIMSGDGAEANVLVFAHDVITVPRAEVVYVMGEVKRSGGFPLGSAGSASVLKALAMAEGLTPAAAPKKAMVLRLVPGGVRSEVPVNLPRILQGKAEDIPLQPNDILLIPDNRSSGKVVAQRALQASIAVLSGVAIWRLGR